MDVVATLIVLTLMLLGLVVLARSWPATSRFGGYRAREGDGSRSGTGAAAPLDEEQGLAAREDDDVSWRWVDREDDSPDR